ncbi:hypothetical protein ACP70R_013778 [Stipagrostis hirtigluma subsp. patula]
MLPHQPPTSSPSRTLYRQPQPPASIHQPQPKPSIRTGPLPAPLAKSAVLANGHAKKTELETQRSVTEAWKKFVLAKKTNGVC